MPARDGSTPKERRAPPDRVADHPRALPWRDTRDHRHEGHYRAQGGRGGALHLETQLRQAQKMEAIGHLAAGILRTTSTTSSPPFSDNRCSQPSARKRLATRRSEAISNRRGRRVARAQDLIQQLLTFARGRRGDRRALSLSALVAEAHRLVRSTMPATLEVQVKLGEVAPVVADPVQLEQVLLNLCINARDALEGHRDRRRRRPADRPRTWWRELPEAHRR